MRKVWDISPLISEKSAVFPGDTKFEREVLLDQNKGDNLDLSTIKTTVHIGAHTDAPNHYDKNGVGIDQRDINIYLGSAQVISVETSGRIKLSDIKNIDIKANRVLFKTNSFKDPNLWHNNFNALSIELVQYLAKRNVILIGIDTPSVDLADDKELQAHHEIAKNDMAILEGIILSDVEDGLYDLIALPLKIKDADASPVRAVLLEKGSL